METPSSILGEQWACSALAADASRAIATADDLKADNIDAKGFSGSVTIFATQPLDAFINEESLANGFGKTTRTIRRWEKDGTLPPRTPGIRMWRVGNILSWLTARAGQLEQTERDRLREEKEFLED